jgi:hypothetical protein
MTPGPPETLTTLVEEDLRPMAPWFDACVSLTTPHRGLDVSSWPQYRIDINSGQLPTEREEGCKKSSSGFSSSTFVLCCSSKRGRGKGKHFGVGGTVEDEVVQLL